MSHNTSSLSAQQRQVRFPVAGEVITLGDRVYTIGDFLGEGYFGKVYACRDRWANDLVAKVLVPRQRSYEEVRKQWQHELNALLDLRHPTITYAYDAFERESTFFLVIERCGTDLNALFTIPQYDGHAWLPALARDLLQGLEYIHDAGYVHKDLHLGNIYAAWSRDRMVQTKEPVVSFKIGDLGITRLESDINVFHTMLAQWMLPPEAIDPTSFGLIGRAVDIYHVGLVFLSVLLGHVPSFTRDEVLAAKPRLMAESLQSPYSGAIAWALRRHVAARPPTAAALWDAILAAVPRDLLPL